MRRRTFLTTAAAALTTPAIASNPKLLIFVPQANLTSLDPVRTTATTTRSFALMV
jgi:peptide/nickel transport system substrate-binding protein